MTSAVIFDLWRTLVPLEDRSRAVAMSELVRILGVKHLETQFRECWARGLHKRETMPLSSYLTDLATDLGLRWTTDQIGSATAARRQAHSIGFAGVREHVFAVLEGLREDGHRLGLISNCSSEVRESLAEHGFDAKFDTCVLSAEVGVMKPDPAIFQLALQRIGARSALYVGDGDSDELAGARRVGLVDVLIDLGDHRSGSHTVHSLTEVRDLARKVLR